MKLALMMAVVKVVNVNTFMFTCTDPDLQPFFTSMVAGIGVCSATILVTCGLIWVAHRR